MDRMFRKRFLIMDGYGFRDIAKHIHEGTEIAATRFHHVLGSRGRLKQLRSQKIQVSSVGQLLRGLVSLNPRKFLLCLLFFTLALVLVVSSPFVTNFILTAFLEQEAVSPLLMVYFIIGYKLAGLAINTVCNFLYSSLGFEYFAFVYWLILDSQLGVNSSTEQGRRVNIVEYDCNLLTMLVYSTLTSLFYFLEIMVLFGLLGSYLTESKSYSVFFLLISAYLLSQCAVSMATFSLNRAYLSQKDRRVGVNVAAGEGAEEARAKELRANRRFLVMKMVCKLVSLVFPMLINVYVFLLVDRSTIRQNQYTILLLINLIRSPIAELMMAMNLNSEILNSLRRIVHFLKGPSLLSPSLLSPSEIQDQLVPQRTAVAGRLMSKERGGVVLGQIWGALRGSIGQPYWVGLALLFVGVVGGKYYGNLVIQHIIAGTCSLQHYLGLGWQVLAPILLYRTLIACTEKVAKSVFVNLRQQIDYETLNRISGDITAIDRSVTINTFEISLALSTILASYIYSIAALSIWWLEVLLIAFLAFSFWAAFALNRFVMQSRREVTRCELEMKASILKGLLGGRRISLTPRLRRKWVRMFECKEMGLFIENYYIVIVNLLMLGLSLLFIVLSEWLVEQVLTKSILLIVCLGIDRDISVLFFSMVRLEISLISFERVLNALAL